MPPRKRRPPRRRTDPTSPAQTPPAATLRIVGGRFRGRKLCYGGDRRVRPMKDRLREAIFNLLGPAVGGKHAVDLFAGTGALGLEALSRGAARATLIERHFPTAEIIRRNVATLGVEEIVQIVTSNVFIWWQRRPELGTTPQVVFCCPPWDFFVDRADEVLALVGGLIASAPIGSQFVVEADGRFDFTTLPDAGQWDVRPYPPAVVGVYRREASGVSPSRIEEG